MKEKKKKVLKRRWCKKCDKLFELDAYHKTVCQKCRKHKQIEWSKVKLK